MADPQRAALYAAHDQVEAQLDFARAGARTVEVFGSTLTLPDELWFGELDHVSRYIKRVQQQDWFVARYPAATTPVTVRKRRGNRSAHYETGGVIAVSQPEHGAAWAMRELTVLHELAHHVVAATFPRGVQSHGPEYAAAFLALVREQLGAEVSLLLQAAFDQHDVTVAHTQP